MKKTICRCAFSVIVAAVATQVAFALTAISVSKISAVSVSAIRVSSAVAVAVPLTTTVTTNYSGPATDFALNPYINGTGSVNSANIRRRINTIDDGSSNTILFGHAYLKTTDYPLTAPVAGFRVSIMSGGTLTTARNGDGSTAGTWLQDNSTTSVSNQWGSPMVEGGLMAMLDGTVRLIGYDTPINNMLTPAEGTPVEVPNAQ